MVLYMEIFHLVISILFVVKIPGKWLVVVLGFVWMINFATATTFKPALLEPLQMAERFVTKSIFLKSNTQIRWGFNLELGTRHWSS